MNRAGYTHMHVELLRRVYLSGSNYGTSLFYFNNFILLDLKCRKSNV